VIYHSISNRNRWSG